MRTAILVIAFLMLADGLFVLLNPDLVHRFIKDAFPNLNIRKIAIAEILFALFTFIWIFGIEWLGWLS